MLGVCLGGPIYRTSTPTKGWATINGRHKLARGKNFEVDCARFRRFRSKLLRKQTWLVSKAFESGVWSFKMVDWIGSCNFSDTGKKFFLFFFGTLSAKWSSDGDCWDLNSIWIGCPPCVLYNFTIFMVKLWKKMKEKGTENRHSELGKREMGEEDDAHERHARPTRSTRQREKKWFLSSRSFEPGSPWWCVHVLSNKLVAYALLFSQLKLVLTF